MSRTGHRRVELSCAGCTTVTASVDFDYTLIGIAQYDTRQLDYYLTFDDWDADGGLERETTPMRVSLSGCGGLITCNPTAGDAIQPLGSWRLAPTFHATMTSANGTGVGVEFIASTVVTLGMAITPVDPRIIPWIDYNMGSGAARFDSTGARAGKHHGSVFPDFIPTYDLIALARADNYLDGVKESVQHIDDALHQPLIHPRASRRFSAPRRPAPREETPMPNVEAVTPTANGVFLP